MTEEDYDYYQELEKATNTGRAYITPIVEEGEEDWPIPNHRIPAHS